MLLHFRVFWGPIKKVSNQGQGTPVVHASEVDKQTFIVDLCLLNVVTCSFDSVVHCASNNSLKHSARYVDLNEVFCRF